MGSMLDVSACFSDIVFCRFVLSYGEYNGVS